MVRRSSRLTLRAPCQPKHTCVAIRVSKTMSVLRPSDSDSKMAVLSIATVLGGCLPTQLSCCVSDWNRSRPHSRCWHCYRSLTRAGWLYIVMTLASCRRTPGPSTGLVARPMIMTLTVVTDGGVVSRLTTDQQRPRAVWEKRTSVLLRRYLRSSLVCKASELGRWMLRFRLIW